MRKFYFTVKKSFVDFSKIVTKIHILAGRSKEAVKKCRAIL